MNLFVDTAGWVALFVHNDKYHRVAKPAFEALLHQRVTLVVTEAVFSEAVTLMRYRVGFEAAQALGEWVRASPHVRWVHTEPAWWDDAWALFTQYDDQDFSLTDCLSFVTMRRLRLRDAFTFDHHFAVMGFRLWPNT